MREKATVLVVDPDAHNRIELLEQLGELGVRTSGFERLELWSESERPNALVYAVHENVEKPAEVMARLHVLGWHVPSVLIIERAGVPEVVAAMRAGAETLIQRPVVVADLLHSVRECLDVDAESRARWREVGRMAERLGDLTGDERRLLEATFAGAPGTERGLGPGLEGAALDEAQEELLRRIEPASLAEIADIALCLREIGLDTLRTDRYC
ncbi:MAG: hypothetical protein GY711_33215 [bacterium]|nr:hypothetical protein [bacterium]